MREIIIAAIVAYVFSSQSIIEGYEEKNEKLQNTVESLVGTCIANQKDRLEDLDVDY